MYRLRYDGAPLVGKASKRVEFFIPLDVNEALHVHGSTNSGSLCDGAPFLFGSESLLKFTRNILKRLKLI